MKKVVKVELLWSENRAYQRRHGDLQPKVPPHFHTVADANARLVQMAQEGPSLGYDKTGFRVTWEDGHTYTGRYDLHRYGEPQENPNGLVDLADHVRGFALFCAGRRKPGHLSQSDYDALRKMVAGPAGEAGWARFLEEYEI